MILEINNKYIPTFATVEEAKRFAENSREFKDGRGNNVITGSGPVALHDETLTNLELKQVIDAIHSLRGTNANT